MSSQKSFGTRRAGSLVVAGTGVALLVWFAIWWWNRPPEMGDDEEVARNVDALFTAITAKDEKLLVGCERRLSALKEADKLPSEASAYLDNVISNARAGGWEKAARSLYDFMRAQRHEETSHHRKRQSALEPGCSPGRNPESLLARHP